MTLDSRLRGNDENHMSLLWRGLRGYNSQGKYGKNYASSVTHGAYISALRHSRMLLSGIQTGNNL